MDMTLREVCDTCNVSRRAIQGYEKTGLILASGKNEWGHLLYDEDSQERIRRIRLFQQMGFSLKEIGEIIDAPNDILKAALVKQIEKLKEQREDIEEIIHKTYAIIEKL